MTTQLFEDPTQTFFAQAQLTPPEEQQAQAVQHRGREAELAEAAVALALGFYLYRRYMRRRIMEEMAGQPPEALPAVIGAVMIGFLPRWVAMIAPALVSSYIDGIKVANSGDLPQEYLQEVAEKYAAELGGHLNEVSAQAAMQGYQAQLNRRVVAKEALSNVIAAFGVPPRVMNTLVNNWTRDKTKVFSDNKAPDVQVDRSDYLINSGLAVRAEQIGTNESWAAHNQGQQLVWMYAQAHGTIPQSATREWDTAEDERVCPVCGPMDHQEIPLSDKFATDEGPIWTPPLHPGCRCHVRLRLNLIEAVGNTIEKAAPGDPYNRDPHGHFARRETRRAKTTDDRPFKEPEPYRLDPKLKALFDQASTDLKFEEPRVIQRRDLSRRNLSGRSLQGRSLTEGRDLTGGRTLSPGRSLKADRLARALTPEQAARKMAEQVKNDKVPHGWVELGSPIMGLLRPREELDPVIRVGKERVLYDRDQGGISEEISNYWSTWANGLRSQAIANRELRRVEINDASFYVDPVHFYELTQMALTRDYNNGVVHEFQARLEDDPETHVPIHMSDHDLISHLELEEKIWDDLPYVMLMNHGQYDVTGVTGSKYGLANVTNPGDWKTKGDAYEVLDGPTELPYMAIHVVPVNLDD